MCDSGEDLYVLNLLSRRLCSYFLNLYHLAFKPFGKLFWRILFLFFCFQFFWYLDVIRVCRFNFVVWLQGLWLRLLKLGATDDPLSSFEYGTILGMLLRKLNIFIHIFWTRYLCHMVHILSAWMLYENL